MEILSTTEHVGEYWLYLIVVGAIFLILLTVTILGAWEMIVDKDFAILLPVVFLLLGAWFFGFLSYDQINNDPKITYRVLITDFNELHNQGYEIIGQDGNIYNIKKKEDGY